MNYRRAAGIKVEKRGPGRPPEKRPGKKELRTLYVEENKSIRDIAAILGCSKDLIFRALQEYGIEMRAHTRESKLSQYSLDFLKERVDKLGYRNAAKSLGVGETTLWFYLKRRLDK